MSLLTDLREAPAVIPTASKFTSLSGALYMASGLLILAWPGVVQTIFLDPAFEAREETLFRVLGMVVTVIGWFYYFGGRSGGRQFVASTVLDRIVLVPLVLIPVAMAGVFPHIILTFGLLDPALGLIAWRLLATTK